MTISYQDMSNVLMRHIRLACSPKFADFSWMDSDYSGRSDESVCGVSTSANIHVAEWMTITLLETGDVGIVTDICKVWLVSLRGQSMSLKTIALIVLSRCIVILRGYLVENEEGMNHMKRNAVACIKTGEEDPSQLKSKPVTTYPRNSQHSTVGSP